MDTSYSGSLRSEATQSAYNTFKQQRKSDASCPLCQHPILVTFTHWQLIVNDFPYDRIAKVHHLLIPKRHVSEATLTTEELRELYHIKQTYLNDHYSLMMEALPRRKSVPAHFHYHLIVEKEDTA